MPAIAGEYEEYDPEKLIWYKKAVDAEGEIICTDVYTDNVYDKSVITIAKDRHGIAARCIIVMVPAKEFLIHDP